MFLLFSLIKICMYQQLFPLLVVVNISVTFQVIPHFQGSWLCGFHLDQSSSSFCRSLSSIMAADSKTSLSNGNVSTQPNPKRSYQVVVAATRDMGIGKDGKLPWKLPSDLKFFKEITQITSDAGKRNAVIMGRKTWESIPLEHRPLPGRLNVVLTRSGSFDIATVENVVICGSIGSALELLAASPYCLSIEKVFVIGGGQILRCVLVFLTLYSSAFLFYFIFFIMISFLY